MTNLPNMIRAKKTGSFIGDNPSRLLLSSIAKQPAKKSVV